MTNLGFFRVWLRLQTLQHSAVNEHNATLTDKHYTEQHVIIQFHSGDGNWSRGLKVQYFNQYCKWGKQFHPCTVLHSWKKTLMTYWLGEDRKGQWRKVVSQLHHNGPWRGQAGRQPGDVLWGTTGSDYWGRRADRQSSASFQSEANEHGM